MTYFFSNKILYSEERNCGKMLIFRFLSRLSNVDSSSTLTYALVCTTRDVLIWFVQCYSYTDPIIMPQDQCKSSNSLQNMATPTASKIHGMNDSSNTTTLNLFSDFASSPKPAAIKIQVNDICLENKKTGRNVV